MGQLSQAYKNQLSNKRESKGRSEKGHWGNGQGGSPDEMDTAEYARLALENNKSRSGFQSVAGTTKNGGFQASVNSRFIKRFKNKVQGVSGGRQKSNFSNIMTNGNQ